MRSYSLYLLVATFIVFFLQLLVPNFTQQLALTPAHIMQQPWTLVTSIFLHGGFLHIFLNMFALLIFGPLLEARLGWKKFLVLYFLAGIAGNVAYAVTASNPLIPALGASGAVYGILGALAVLEPNMMIFMWFVPMPMKYAVVVWVALNFFGTFGETNIAYWAHLAGLFLGLGFAKYFSGKGLPFQKY